jgi:hypothetical protein
MTLLAATPTSSYGKSAGIRKPLLGTHQILFKIVNLGDPQQSHELANCFPEREYFWFANVIHEECIRLSNGLELSTDQ